MRRKGAGLWRAANGPGHSYGSITVRPVEVRIPMGDARFADGSPQPLYFPPDHPTHPGLFKGMAVILEERGYTGARKIRAECIGFKCPKDPDGEYGHCCCRRILFNEPDFVNVPSLLSSLCAKNNVPAIFLPKFSPELNPIEMLGICKADLS